MSQYFNQKPISQEKWMESIMSQMGLKSEGRIPSIKSSDRVRRDVSSIETYWEKPGKALTKIQDILHNHGYVLGETPSFNVHDKSNDHIQRFKLEKFINKEKPEEGSEEVINMLIFSWHWMESGVGKCEVTAYIS